MKDANQLNHWIKLHGDLALDLVRIYLGIGLMVKAGYIAYNRDLFLQQMDSMGSMWFAPAIAVHYVILAHAFGGFCLAIGLITRGAAVVQIPILIGALFYMHLPQMAQSLQARQSAEFAGLVLFLLVLFSVYGAGRWSVDHWLAKKEFDKLFEPQPRPMKS
jgi:uncharacterized membrane protein YphA (DoxX/SURF4 family)